MNIDVTERRNVLRVLRVLRGNNKNAETHRRSRSNARRLVPPLLQQTLHDIGQLPDVDRLA